ncbi:PWWP domain-containing protein 2A isoform X1 [Gopherus evgoodei]|uniref:PWWP domain-containing protein 2A isoform X1 n=2 Tax=Gopherus evgoodei TaxID=1825980 RepID=UPI0011CEDC19|nr:PWWP domain-containing protein 2A isoform X1 [Gopherus evgoodei]XP_030427386.1 PWWP domain-containing protein 2A isoform X1 [Gopherus evgoodei]XP_030427388.1 PWWP domain-containing protein 2A isoform X1 [Gopherus evgoodei]XP_030427389.1 PWWP domain-containing protein 2A isoform X1 [Gopherus evgoodei]
MSMMSAIGGLCLPGGRRRPRLSIPLLEGGGGEAAEKMAAMAAEAVATAAVPGDGGAGEAEPEMEPIPGSEAGADPLPAVSEAVESAVPDGDEADGGKPAPGEAEEPPPPVELARSPARTQEPEPERTEPEEPELGSPQSEPREAPSPEPEEAPQPCPPPAGHPELPEEEPQPCPPAAGGPVQPEPGEEPCRPEEEEPDAADAAAVKPESPAAGSPVAPAEGEAEAPLLPGSEVRVTLDHIIEDALVVSFRLGEKLFSGVLMDLSKRFGPHGIPVTIFPKREYKDKPEAMQLQSKPFQDETQVKCEASGAVPDDSSSPIQPSEPSLAKSLWTSKPPPLFHEGAPYPPPLFIRDTYNQSIPQPPPRKIKRPKRKMYREEPTSIMNAIKLRPRQVLCDKCKNSVVAEKKEIKKSGHASDCLKYEDHKKRRNESVTTVNKKLKTDHKVDGKSQNESQKRNAVVKVSNIAHSRSKVVKVSAQANTSKAQLNTKKVLQSKNMDHAKAREVLKMAKEKAQKKQSATSTSKNAHSKVHFTRRLQNTSSGSLPPRLRLKPQRYRNEENDSSLKTGLEKIRSGKMATKPQSRCSSTRSAGEAPSENQSPSEGPEEASGEVQDTSEVHVTVDQDEHQTLGKRGSKSNITVYMTLNQKKSDSSSASVCSSDSTDDLKSTNSECSSTESFDFPPGSMHAPSSSSSSSSSKEEKKLSNSLKMKVFSKNVSKCVTPDGRTICVGDIVWAKIYGFPWWPARILTITVSRKDNGLLVRQEARISWFGSPTTSFLALSQLSPFLENFQSRFNKKRKGLYRKAITEAAKAAKQLTPEVRALLTQFET